MIDPNKINKLDTTPFLDLREGWKKVSKQNVERIINSQYMGKCWRFNEGQTIITTIEGGKVTNYEVNKTDIIFDRDTKITEKVTQKTGSELLENLFLDPTCEVNSALEAKDKARYSDKKKFWLQNGNMVTIIDYSYGEPPRIKRYPLDTYNLKKEIVEI